MYFFCLSLNATLTLITGESCTKLSDVLVTSQSSLKNYQGYNKTQTGGQNYQPHRDLVLVALAFYLCVCVSVWEGRGCWDLLWSCVSFSPAVINFSLHHFFFTSLTPSLYLVVLWISSIAWSSGNILFSKRNLVFLVARGSQSRDWTGFSEYFFLYKMTLLNTL